MKIPESKFSPVTADIIEKIRIWRNSPRVRSNMLDDTEIKIQQQKQWFESLATSNDKQYKVFYQNLKPVGMLYFSDISKESCSWGCYIGEEAVWPGTGVLLSIAALDYAFDILEVERLSAKVFESNASPIRMHQAFGYTPMLDRLIITRSGQEVKLKSFFYLKKDWKINREIIISKLPKQIRIAADFIFFD